MIEVALTQLILWYDAARIQTWPALLARVPHDLVLASPTHFGRQFLTARQTDERHSVAEKATRNLPGLERVKGRLLLRGVGLLERQQSARQYSVSAMGASLGQAYAADRRGRGWVRELALLLLTREPRTRILMALLSETDASLVFERGWFADRTSRAVIRRPGEPDLKPFAAQVRGCIGLRDALIERAWWSLGSWREHPLLRDHDRCRLVGQANAEVSMHAIGLALHASCEVFLALGVIKGSEGEWALDHSAARHELGELAEDFGWRQDAGNSGAGSGLVELLVQLLPGLRLDTGFVVASALRERLLAAGYRDPDRALGELERRGSIRIYAEDYGQSRHGIGLYNDPRKQLIKIRIVTEGTHA